MEILFKYYGLDWLSILLSIIAVIKLGNKIKWGFVAFLAANILWILIGFTLLKSYAIVVGNSVFLITNFRGYQKWSTPNESNKESASR